MRINIRETDLVPIYDNKGQKLSEIKLPEKIMPIPLKRGGFSKSGIYYKGSGIVYRNHLGNEEEASAQGVLKIGNSGLIYEKYILEYPMCRGKFGIFTFPHQPCFSDYEGGCGKKEKKIITNAKEFEYSAVEILNTLETGLDDHNIYAYKYKDLKGGIEDTVRLIEYVLCEDWNTAWDKNVWSDIYAFGYVTDVADWFKSDKYVHKLGTVFSILNSLYQSDKRLYARLLMMLFGEYSFDKKDILIYSHRMVGKYNRNIDGYNLDEDADFKELYKELIQGKACCHLEDDEKWMHVREELKK